MAIVANEYTNWRGFSGSDADMGRLLVWADDTGQRTIDRVEIDNTQCTANVRVVVTDDNGTTFLDRTLAPGETFTDIQARGQRWTRNTQQKVSQWFVSTVTWR